MPYDNYAARGATKASKPDAGGANLRPVPVFAIVKDIVDPVKAGRIQVYIDDLGGTDPDDSNNWITVSYLPAYFGYTDGSGGTSGYGSFTTNPASYGMWFSPPDIGTEVICIFVNGDPNYGFYIGAPPVPEALRMVPAIGANFDNEDTIFNEGEAKSYGSAKRLPVTNMNTNNTSLADNPNFINAPKPVHSYTATIMNQQGIIRDPIRGPIGTSSQRESPSRVGWGVSTPGRPIYEGGFTDESVSDAAGNPNQQAGLKIIGRRGGHSIVMDDGDLIGNDQLIRLRTALGHQILLSDNGQTLMILHANGQSYIELGKEGTIDMYSTNSVNIRTQGDLNLHADNNVNIHATKELNMFAETMNFESDKTFNQKIGSDSSIYTMGKHTHKVDNAMSFSSDGDASFASSNTTFINGKNRVNLNTGETSTVPDTVKSITKVAQTDTVYDEEKGFMAAAGNLPTIVSRAPAHCPWANAGQGVNVKTNLSASSQFPSSPSPSVSATNAAAGPVNLKQAVTPAGIATVPGVSAVSGALDKTTSSALVGSMALSAATGPAAKAVEKGAGIVTNAQGKLTASVGNLAMTPDQMQTAGYLKPGSATTVNGLIQGGASLQKALPGNLFTGKNGVTSLNSLVNNTQAQATAATDLLQKSQTALTNAGAITGKEGAGAIAGVVLSGAIAGVDKTVDAIKNAGSNTAGVIKNLPGAPNNLVNNAISAGNFAGKLAQTGINGLSSIASSATKSFTDIANIAKGAAAMAFAAIKNSFKPFQAGVPQNLKSIFDKQAVENQAGAALSKLPNAAGVVSGLSNTISNQAANITQAANNFNSGVNSVSSENTSLPKEITSAATSAAQRAITAGASITSASAVASGVANLPGGQQAISAVSNLSEKTNQTLNQVASASSLASNAFTSATNGISTSNAALSKLNPGTAISAAAGGQLQNLKNTALSATADLTNKLKAQKAGLTTLVGAGLPAAAAAQLQAQIASVSSVGESVIKLPSVGVGTNDRSQIEGQISSTLGDKKIPSPNYSGEISQTATKSYESTQSKIVEKAKKVKELDDKYSEQKKIVDQKILELKEARNTLPEGDPKIAELQTQAYAELKKLPEIYNERLKILTS